MRDPVAMSVSLVLAAFANRLTPRSVRVIPPRENAALARRDLATPCECMQFAEPHYRFGGGAHFAVIGIVPSGDFAPGLVHLPAAQLQGRAPLGPINTTMHIRITRPCPITIDGVSVGTMVGRVYDLHDSIGKFLIATGYAEPSEQQTGKRPPTPASRDSTT